MPKALKYAAALLVALASAAIGWFGVKWWQDSQSSAAPAPTTSSTPTQSAIAYANLTLDVTAVSSEFSGLMPRPECGSEWSAEPTAANGVEVVAGSVLDDGNVDALVMSSGYTASGADALAFLSAEARYVITRDGVVVSPDWGAELVPQYFVAASATLTPTGGQVTVTAPTLCDVADELAAIWADVDFATATDEEIAAAQEASDAFNEANASLPAGEYRVYAVAPVTLGEEAAIARALDEEGVTNIGTLSYSIGESALSDDPRLAEYCSDESDASGDVIARNCDVPQDVLSEILTREVPASYVLEGVPALAISEPIVITVP